VATHIQARSKCRAEVARLAAKPRCTEKKQPTHSYNPGWWPQTSFTFTPNYLVKMIQFVFFFFKWVGSKPPTRIHSVRLFQWVVDIYRSMNFVKKCVIHLVGNNGTYMYFWTDSMVMAYYGMWLSNHPALGRRGCPGRLKSVSQQAFSGKGIYPI